MRLGVGHRVLTLAAAVALSVGVGVGPALADEVEVLPVVEDAALIAGAPEAHESTSAIPETTEAPATIEVPETAAVETPSGTGEVVASTTSPGIETDQGSNINPTLEGGSEERIDDTTESNSAETEFGSEFDSSEATIPEPNPVPETTNAYAIYDTKQGSLTFTRATETDAPQNSKNSIVYTGFETASYGNWNQVPWAKKRGLVRSVVFSDVIAPVSTANWFAFFSNLTSFDAGGLLDMSNVVSTSGMFYYCSRLTSVNMADWDVRNLQDASVMFLGCSSLTSIDVTDWRTPQLRSLNGTFISCSGLTSLDLSSLDVSNVSSFSQMLSYADRLQNVDLSGWDTSAATTMAQMFENCASLTDIRGLSDFRTEHVGSFYRMFNNCAMLQQIDLSGSGWSTAAVYDLSGMFRECVSLIQIKLSPTFKFSKRVTDTQNVELPGAEWLLDETGESYDSATLAVSGVPSLAETARGATLRRANFVTAVLYDDGLLAFGVGPAQHREGAGIVASFENFVERWWVLTGAADADAPWLPYADRILAVVVRDSIDIPFADRWFDGCANLVSVEGVDRLRLMPDPVAAGIWPGQYVSSRAWSTGDLSYMFRGCASLTAVDGLDGWDVANATNMHGMFWGCSSLTELGLGPWDVSGVRDMSYMFYGCSALRALDVGGWHMPEVRSYSYMFWGCSALDSFDAGGWRLADGFGVTGSSTCAPGSFSDALRGAPVDAELTIGPGFTFGAAGFELPGEWWFNAATGDRLRSADMMAAWDAAVAAGSVEGPVQLVASDYVVVRYDDGAMVLQWANDPVDADRSVTCVYRVSDTARYRSGELYVPWHNRAEGVTSFAFARPFAPTSLYAWFSNMADLVSIDGLDLVDTSGVANYDNCFRNCGSLMQADVSTWTIPVELALVAPPVALEDDGAGDLELAGIPEEGAVPAVASAPRPLAMAKGLASGVSRVEDKVQCGSAARFAGLPGQRGDGSKARGIVAALYADGELVIRLGRDSDFDDSGDVSGDGVSVGSLTLPEGASSASDERVPVMFYELGDGCLGEGQLAPWYDKRGMIRRVTFGEGVAPESMAFWFAGLDRLVHIDFGSLDTSRATSMQALFADCGALAQLDVSGFDTGNVTNMSRMFAGCSSLAAVDVSGFDTRNVTDVSGMFAGCASLEGVDISRFDTSGVTNMSGMFSGCESLASLDLLDFSTSAVVDMKEMFSGCGKVCLLDLSGFDASNVKAVDGMLSGCKSLAALDVSSFSAEQVSAMSVPTDNAGGFWRLNVPEGYDAGVTLREPTAAELAAAGGSSSGNGGNGSGSGAGDDFGNGSGSGGAGGGNSNGGPSSGNSGAGAGSESGSGSGSGSGAASGAGRGATTASGSVPAAFASRAGRSVAALAASAASGTQASSGARSASSSSIDDYDAQEPAETLSGFLGSVAATGLLGAGPAAAANAAGAGMAGAAAGSGMTADEALAQLRGLMLAIAGDNGLLLGAAGMMALVLGSGSESGFATDGDASGMAGAADGASGAAGAIADAALDPDGVLAGADAAAGAGSGASAGAVPGVPGLPFAIPFNLLLTAILLVVALPFTALMLRDHRP